MSKNKNIKKLICLFVFLFILLLTACGPPKVDWELTVRGDVSNPTTFTFAELAEMPQTNLDDVLMEKSRGEDEVRSFSGVELTILLDVAGAPDNFDTITAIAADGYAIEISRDEMVNGIVALKQGGEWIEKIDQKAAPIRLVFPTTPANRWVFKVNEIVINQQ